MYLIGYFAIEDILAFFNDERRGGVGLSAGV
jgi:hypothetical protein